ncbi:MAG: DNA polymerase III subunit chi [Burkholderiales bacterium]
MTEVHFYSQVADKLATACRVTAKARVQGLRVLISLASAEDSEKLDRLMWVAPALSFVPHCVNGHELCAETPVLLRCSPTSDAADVLINLAADTPDDFVRFERVVELVGMNEDELATARAKWRFYRDSGCALHNHKLGEQE